MTYSSIINKNSEYKNKTMKIIKNKSIIIFGSTGDLVKRKILPSLFYLFENKIIENSKIFCIGRQNINIEDYIKLIEPIFLESINKNSKNIKEFYKNIFYIKADFDCEDCNNVRPVITLNEKKFNLNSRLFYLSLPANAFKKTVLTIHKEKLINKKSKVLIEKPFGEDLKSSVELDMFLKKYFEEKQIHIIDHYLAKEVLINILKFRKINYIKNIFDNKNIEKININIFEKVSVEGRCDFYNRTGAIKDFFQNHILQLISLLFLDINKKNINKEKDLVLKNLEIKKIILKQYKDYKEECGDDGEDIETGFDMILNIKNKNFNGVEVDLRYAKNMPDKVTEVVINLKDKSKIILDILNNDIKINSEKKEFKNFDYKKLKEKVLIDDYKKIIYDSLIGNKKIFVDYSFIKESWKIIEEIKYNTKNSKLKLY